MDNDKYREIADAMREIRDRVGDILTISPSCGTPAGEILQALTRIDNASFGRNPSMDPQIIRHREGDQQHKRNKPKNYAREVVGGYELLAEYRRDSHIPLRSPKEVLDAVVDILSQSKKPLPFREIQKKLTHHFSKEPPDYQARIATRFLLSPGVDLVKRINSKYAAIQPTKIKRDAKHAWDSVTTSK